VRIAIVGAGISGLAAAFRLRECARRLAIPLDLTVLEAEPRVGGHAVTLESQGFLVETGPNAFLDRHEGHHSLALAQALGLSGELIEASSTASRRFIVHGGRLRRVPEAPPTLITSDLLSPAGKARMLLEPWAKAPPAGVEETVFDFAARRMGRQAAERLVDTAIAGISAGDSRELSASAAFPLMIEMERDHGSLIRAMMHRRRFGRPRLMSFRRGLDALTGALRATLGDAVRVGARVTRIYGATGGWRVEASDRAEAPPFDRVVLAVHAHQAAPLVAAFDAPLADRLDAQPTAGLALVALAYRRRDLGVEPRGYGYLVARSENLDTLGVVWESSLFEGRAPQDAVLLRVMMGGARRPEVAGLADAELEARARRELASLMRIDASPLHAWVRRFPRAIAQYTLGHAGRLAAIHAHVARHPGLDLCGTSYDGVSFNAAVAAGERLAARVFPERAATVEVRASTTPASTEEKAHA
jgi:protoporphyrinogen/coproporphyrinogen III oxidase